MPSYSELRCSDADRERVVVFLREQHFAGRLSNDDLDERVGRAYAAVTIGDLEHLLEDLPRRYPPPHHHVAARAPQRRSDTSKVLIPLGIVGLAICGGPILIGLMIAVVFLAGALIFAAGLVLAPFILVAVLVALALRRRRPPSPRMHWQH